MLYSGRTFNGNKESTMVTLIVIGCVVTGWKLSIPVRKLCGVYSGSNWYVDCNG